MQRLEIQRDLELKKKKALSSVNFPNLSRATGCSDADAAFFPQALPAVAGEAWSSLGRNRTPVLCSVPTCQSAPWDRMVCTVVQCHSPRSRPALWLVCRSLDHWRSQGGLDLDLQALWSEPLPILISRDLG